MMTTNKSSNERSYNHHVLEASCTRWLYSDPLIYYKTSGWMRDLIIDSGANSPNPIDVTACDGISPIKLAENITAYYKAKLMTAVLCGKKLSKYRAALYGLLTNNPARVIESDTSDCDTHMWKGPSELDPYAGMLATLPEFYSHDLLRETLWQNGWSIPDNHSGGLSYPNDTVSLKFAGSRMQPNANSVAETWYYFVDVDHKFSWAIPVQRSNTAGVFESVIPGPIDPTTDDYSPIRFKIPSYRVRTDPGLISRPEKSIFRMIEPTHFKLPDLINQSPYGL